MAVKRKRKRKTPAPSTNGTASTLVVDQIEMIDPATLNEAEYNPREITAEALKRLQTIIEHHGFVKPIIVNRKNNTVIGGNQRLKVAIAMGIEKVPVVFVSEDDISGEKALNIALNAGYGEFGETKMMSVLASLTPAGYDLNMTGFNPAQFKKLLGANWEKELMAQVNGTAPQAEEEVPEVPKKPKSKLGDLYELGDHRLLCGDATVAGDYGKLMAGEKAGMVFTDPPYNVDYGNIKHPKFKVRSIENDNLSNEEWKSFCWSIFSNIKNQCRGDTYVWGAPSPDGMKMRLWLIDMGFHWSATIIWKKHYMTLGRAKYQRMYEPCFYGWTEKSSFQNSRDEVELWEVDRPTASKLHPTMKPIELCERGIRNSSKLQDLVLDPFGGSGSTLIACENLGRRCRMMELDPGYVDVIQERWQNATGKKAKKIR